VLLAERGFEDYALLTTARASAAAPALAEWAATVLHVPAGRVPDAAAAVRDGVRGRPLVALGGGRVIDSAKAIGAADGLPCAAVPTTLSGAEMTQTHRLLADAEGRAQVRPSLVLAHPGLMASQPVPALAASAMNALAHAAEALWVPASHPVAEMAALRAAELISGALQPQEPERDRLALGSVLAAYAMDSTGYAVHHVTCQNLVRIAGTPHAETNAVMLPHSIALVAARAPALVGRLGAALGVSGPRPGEASERVAELAARTGVNRLRDLGADPSTFPAVVEAVLSRADLASTPGPPGPEELAEYLERAY
jgi:maleylacetate reductase